MEDRGQVLTGGLLDLARNASGIVRRATKNSETFLKRFPKKRWVFPNVSPRIPEQKGGFPEETRDKSRKNLPRTSKKYGMNAGIVWGISR